LPPHSTRFGYMAVSLTQHKLGKSWARILDNLKQEIEPVVINSGYLEGAPFSWIGIAILYGLRYDKVPEYEPIDKTYGDLPMNMEIDVRDIVEASDEDIYYVFKYTSLLALIHAGRKYDRPISVFVDMLEELERSGQSTGHLRVVKSD